MSQDSSPRALSQTAPQAESEPMSQSSSAAHPLPPVILKDGAKIQVWVSPGVGTPLLFLYGLGCSNAHWKYQLKHFQAAGRLTIQLDLRGHGESTLGNPHRPLTIRSLGQDIAEVIEAIGVKEAVALGQSMGGSIALQLAHDRPDLIKALVLQGSPGRDPFARMQIGVPVARAVKFLALINHRLPRLTRLLNRAAALAPQIAREIVRIKGFNARLAKSEDIDEYVRNFFACDPNIFYELADDLADFNISHFKHIIDCPTLILAGAKDRVVPIEECRWLAKRLPAAELDIMAHGSHCPHLDDPFYVNQRIERFLKTYES